jgi:hypothetical protein
MSNNKSDKVDLTPKDNYLNFLKVPQPKTKNYYDEMKEHRIKYGYTKNRIDIRPRTFLSIMKIEVILLLFGVAFAVTLPFYSYHLHAKLQEPDETNIENIENRIHSKPSHKSQLKIKKEYANDEKHAKMQMEIEKTYRELYGEDYKKI